ncbi:MAG: hypothetical protein A2252_09410 [Elusimicrobia bacterium RIFOXYA2_FULL_39_19]|nr:MAG: hypothetical protein A2252_09410 [Elusimicrobia bacterium RIFOXYA2_FULL_39_19]
MKTKSVIIFLASLWLNTAFCAEKSQENRYIGMVYVPAGVALIGTDEGFVCEKPRHVLFIKGFYIDKNEVTNSQYKIFIDATKRSIPAHWINGTYPQGYELYPVTNVTYYDAFAYAKWAGKRLPKEEEWEKAAKGKKNYIYPWGEQWEDECANVRSLFQFFDGLMPVGSYPLGKSVCGAFDMAGNAREWTASWFIPYKESFNWNENMKEYYKVIRGGSYKTTKGMSQVFRRDMLEPDGYSEDLGFRCVKDE